MSEKTTSHYRQRAKEAAIWTVVHIEIPKKRSGMDLGKKGPRVKEETPLLEAHEKIRYWEHIHPLLPSYSTTLSPKYYPPV